MKCPPAEDLLRRELGELLTHRANDVEQHLLVCASCAQRQRVQHELLAALSEPPPLQVSDSAFTEGVLRRRDAQERAPATVPRRSVRWAVGLAAAAVLAASWLFVPRLAQQQGTFTARGANHQAADATFVEVLRVRANGLEPIRGATLRPGDGIGVRFSNAGKMPRYLMVFALDSQREIHWIYPAYLDPASNPRAVPLANQRTVQLLDEAVEPEAPAPGALRVVTLVLSEPMTVKDVEGRIVGESPDVKRLFPAAQVSEWGCTWTAK